jgi:glucosamine-6-phosphate deaminase
MADDFEFGLARWIPFRDAAACARVRAITKEEITRHLNPDFKIRLVPEDQFPFRLVMDIFSRIKQAAEEGRKLVLILPQPEPLYSQVAELINRFGVDCRNLYTFNMDEYADEEGNIAPETWPNSFLHHMKKNFYGKVDVKFRPPEHQIVGPTDANFSSYGEMIEDLGGADVCYGGIGWSGHLAFIEPGSEAFPAVDLKAWQGIGPQIVELSPFTVLQCSLGPEFGQSGDWSGVPPKAATVGPAQIVGARLRCSWNGFRVGNSMVSWQRFILRLACHGPVTPLVPASILQTLPTELYMAEPLAEDIELASEFSWY